MIKFIPCRKCVGKNGRNPEGYIIKQVPSGNGQGTTTVAVECECHKAWREATKLEVYMQKAGIAADAAKYNISDYVGTKSLANVNRLKTFTERSLDKNETPEVKSALAASSLYIYGPNGTQKTTLSMWMGYEFLRSGKKVKYILMNELIKLLMKADRDEEIQAQLEKISDVDLLIIDESFMKERVTLYRSGYQLSFLDTFLRNRMQTNKKGVVFISNISIEEIDRNLFGDGLIDLVKRNVYLCKGDLLFEDNYLENKSSIDTSALF
jgi:DNA replication protein DnaC